MNPKVKKYAKEIAKTLIILTIILNVVSYFKSQDLNKEQLNIQTFKLLDNSTYTVPNDKPILVHFWATWCPTCKIEAGNIERVSKDYEVITIASQSGSKEEIQKYLEKNNLTFKVVNDLDGEFASQFNISAYPTTFIYNKDKNMTFSEVGYTSTFGLFTRMWWSN